jgi:hypothetical protein
LASFSSWFFSFSTSLIPKHGTGSQASPHSSLTVTATVEPSVWLVIEPDGTQEVVVANSADSRESFSHAPDTKAGGKIGTSEANMQTPFAAPR